MLQKLQEIFAFDNKKRDPYIQVYRETKIVYILEIIPPNYRARIFTKMLKCVWSICFKMA